MIGSIEATELADGGRAARTAFQPNSGHEPDRRVTHLPVTTRVDLQLTVRSPKRNSDAALDEMLFSGGRLNAARARRSTQRNLVLVDLRCHAKSAIVAVSRIAALKKKKEDVQDSDHYARVS
jgi:hypothetical protein